MPFLYLLYDFSNYNFFGGNKRKLTLDLPLHQTEGIASSDGLNYFLSNEKYENTEQKLHKIDLKAFLENYLKTLPVEQFNDKSNQLKVFPNPVSNSLLIEIDYDLPGGYYYLYDLSGKIILHGSLHNKKTEIKIEALNKGIYLLMIKQDKIFTRKIIKI